MDGMLKLDPEFRSQISRDPAVDRGMLQRFFDSLDDAPRFVGREEPYGQYDMRMSDEGRQAIRRLLEILKGGRPSREPAYEPPAPPLNRGRAQRQPPVIGVRG